MLNSIELVVFLIIFAALAMPWILRAWVHRTVGSRVCRNLKKVPPTGVAIVLGAGLGPDGSPNTMLYNRVSTATQLYKAGVVRKLLMSGYNRSADYNEPAVMKDLAIQMGVPEEAIMLDSAGRRTYDSCYRARHIFNVERAVVVTQSSTSTGCCTCVRRWG